MPPVNTAAGEHRRRIQAVNHIHIVAPPLLSRIGHAVLPRFHAHRFDIDHIIARIAVLSVHCRSFAAQNVKSRTLPAPRRRSKQAV
ncbi:hypothetical protein [Neisseria sp. KEM232]|uniref:hypothetical protein n=1 Tax=Neisseria sp. KEM232 TaxID=655307 RepID=UPI001E5126CE|nr:hypothetical protein [Neisseria sp. KEM232]